MPCRLQVIDSTQVLKVFLKALIIKADVQRNYIIQKLGWSSQPVRQDMHLYR
ncbi:MAG: hypothetical protein AAF063_10945 [Cyanobacteria bacterium J06643_5]